MRCGARCKQSFGLCRARVTPGRERCRRHGGYSTGVKTIEGRARQIAGARAWALKRRRDNPDRKTF